MFVGLPLTTCKPTPLKDLVVLLAWISFAAFDSTRWGVGLVDFGEAILFLSVPSPVIDTLTSSPGPRYVGGLRPMPTPAGCSRR